MVSIVCTQSLLVGIAIFLSRVYTAQSQSESCTPSVNEYPRFVNLKEFFPSPQLLDNPEEILLPTYVFRCPGYITHWEASTVGRGAHGIEFQVWRRRALNMYDLIGINIFPNVQPNNNLLLLSVPEAEQIHMERGDIVGIRTILSEESDPFRIQIVPDQGEIINYRFSERYNDTPSLLDISGIFFFGRMSIAPMINARLFDNSTMATTTTDSTGPSPTTLPQSTVITMAAFASVLAIFAVLFLIFILITCIRSKKRNARMSNVCSENHVQGQRGPRGIDMAYNSAYSQAENSPSSHIEQTEMTMVNNSAVYSEANQPAIVGITTEDEEPYYTRICDAGTDDSYVPMK